MATVAEELQGRGVNRGGELMLRAHDAIAFVQRCRARGMEVLGVDGFHLTETTRQPDMGESIDLSRVEDHGRCERNWDRAEQFLLQRIRSDLHFHIVVDET